MSDTATQEGPASRRVARTPTGAPAATTSAAVKHEVIGLLLLGGALLLALTLLSHRPATSALEESRNLIGPVGAFVADVLFFSFGVGSFVVAFLTVLAAISLLVGRPLFERRGEAVGYGMMLVAGSCFFGVVAPDTLWWGYPPGGLLGQTLGVGLSAAIGKVGGAIVSTLVMATGFMLVTQVSLIGLLERALARGEFSLAMPTFGGWLASLRTWMRERAEAQEAERAEAARARELAERGHQYDRGEAHIGGTIRTSFATLRDALERVAKRSPSSDAAPAPARAKRTARVARVVDAADGPDTDPPWAADLSETPSQPLPRPAGSVSAAIDIDAIDPSAELPEEQRVTRNVQITPPSAARPESMRTTSPATASSTPVQPDSVDIGPAIIESAAQKARKRAADLERVQQQRLDLGATVDWELPPLSFLAYEEGGKIPVDHNKLRDKAAQLEEALASFKVRGRVSGICPGPVVTRYEYEPEQGTKLSKISSLSNDIAMALKAQSVRIIAPIPGKGCVGIEIPNEGREPVYLKEIIADERFTTSRSKLTVALGKDIEGNPVVADLAKMPHLLVAGTTGSGKSVSVNAMIVSVLYNSAPEDVRMIMIDPKQLEFAIYKDIPHLLLPVVTDPSKAATALNWAVNEMERRYHLMAEMKVRDLTGYNRKLKELQAAKEQAQATGQDPLAVDPQLELLEACEPDGRATHRHMFYVLVIVDEFADLMMVARKEVEVSVARLAQKARAAGIHVVLATQRPSVDVITGLIKANFPTRMSCRLMSGTDSRTVLDEMGAETLLGMGDMLFRPPGRSDLVRVHGAYVDEREIERICDFLKKQRKPQYDETILQAGDDADQGDEDEPADALYDDAVMAVLEAGFASISMVQRKLGVGYNRAAKMIEMMERRGIVGPAQGGSARREVVGAGRINSPY